MHRDISLSESIPSCLAVWPSAAALAQMSPATVDGSSAISESRKLSIISRDGGLCVLCGMDPVGVAHIVARNSGDHGRVSETDLLLQMVELHTQIGRLIGFARWHHRCQTSEKTTL
jgi:hypothetical protein